MSNSLVRTIIVTLMILALVAAMAIRHNRQRIQIPRRSAPMSMPAPPPAQDRA